VDGEYSNTRMAELNAGLFRLELRKDIDTAKAAYTSEKDQAHASSNQIDLSSAIQNQKPANTTSIEHIKIHKGE